MAKCDDDDVKSPVRARVKRHLKHLLIPGLMGLGACKSSGGDVVCDPLPAPPLTDTAAPPDGPYAEPPPVEEQDAGKQEPEPPPVVCDPLPPPPRTP